MSLEIVGKYLGASAITQVGEAKSNKRSFWLDTSDGDYPNTPQFELWKDKCSIVDGLQKGDKVRVYFNLNGRKYTNKTTGKEGVFNSIGAWKVEKVEESQPPVSNDGMGDVDMDSLPF